MKIGDTVYYDTDDGEGSYPPWVTKVIYVISFDDETVCGVYIDDDDNTRVVFVARSLVRDTWRSKESL